MGLDDADFAALPAAEKAQIIAQALEPDRLETTFELCKLAREAVKLASHMTDDEYVFDSDAPTQDLVNLKLTLARVVRMLEG